MLSPGFFTLLTCSLLLPTDSWAPQRRRPSSLSSSFGWPSSTALLGHNVVLRPSEAATAFDSFKIGSAKVHRYSRSSDPDSETEYVMWYHGRSKDFDSEKELPPLSTGRIGRATSKNGLHWVKDEIGSASEDITGVSLGLNKESWWGFDTAHVGLGSVLLPMTTPAVLTEGGVYILYFFGGNFEETRVIDYLDSTKVPEAMADTKIKGMRMKIGVAVSQDGISWGRVEGDSPDMSCVSIYDTSDPNLASSLRGDSESIKDLKEELYCGWPEVVVRVPGDGNDPKGEPFLMFYSTMLRDTKQKCIAYAVSKDGFRWFKRGLCLMPDNDGLDVGGCARSSVIRDAVFDKETLKWKELDFWNMYYEGVGKDGKHRIMMAESQDGKTWEKIGLVLEVGSEGEWDEAGVGAPHVVRLDDGTQRMYYTGQSSKGETAIGVAKRAAGALEWVREQAAVVFA